ncbi:rod shape-determining protein MreD [Phaeobacter sp. CNT1-3]|jgi:rod shape-determining protein MreD|nr:rod shape-determining protein MreD [Phaeobacter sp. CNT1-3]
MSDTAPAQPWVKQLVFAGLCLAVIFFQLLPLETTPRRWTGPDLVLLICLTWSMRRPDFAPVYLIALVALMADLMLQRPPGLLAALTVVASQTLTKRARQMRDQGFAVEWLTIAGALLVVMLGNRLVLSLAAVPQAPLGLTIIQLIMSVLCYPAVVAAAHFLFGVRKVAPGEVDAWGQKL